METGCGQFSAENVKAQMAYQPKDMVRAFQVNAKTPEALKRRGLCLMF